MPGFLQSMESVILNIYFPVSFVHKEQCFMKENTTLRFKPKCINKKCHTFVHSKRIVLCAIMEVYHTPY